MCLTRAVKRLTFQSHKLHN